MSQELWFYRVTMCYHEFRSCRVMEVFCGIFLIYSNHYDGGGWWTIFFLLFNVILWLLWCSFGGEVLCCKKMYLGGTAVYVKDTLCKILWWKKNCKTPLAQGACCVERPLMYQFFGGRISISENYCGVKFVLCKCSLVRKPFGAKVVWCNRSAVWSILVGK